jgi:hypothetical protein
MDRSKKIQKNQFSVTRQYIVEISQTTLVRTRVALREQYPEVVWDEDESVINAIVEDYTYKGAHDELVAGPFIVVHRLLSRP